MNRSLSLDKIKFFGFDMDYTLAGNAVRKVSRVLQSINGMAQVLYR